MKSTALLLEIRPPVSRMFRFLLHGFVCLGLCVPGVLHATNPPYPKPGDKPREEESNTDTEIGCRF